MAESIKNFELLLFDLDDTLFDSQKTEKIAFANTLNHFGITDSDGSLLKKYRELSYQLWADYSKGLLTKEEVKVTRYQELFKTIHKNFDAVEASEHHVEEWVRHPFLIEGAEEVLTEIKNTGHKIGIVTNGFQETQERRLVQTPIHKLVDFLVVPEECGFSKPHPKIFDYSFGKAQHENKNTTLMIGDHLETDILGAHNYEIKSAWFNHKKAKNPFDFKPHIEIRTLNDLLLHI